MTELSVCNPNPKSISGSQQRHCWLFNHKCPCDSPQPDFMGCVLGLEYKHFIRSARCKWRYMTVLKVRCAGFLMFQP